MNIHNPYCKEVFGNNLNHGIALILTEHPIKT